MHNLNERLWVLVQRMLPVRLLGALVYRLTRSRTPWLKNGLIRGFMRAFPVDRTEMDQENPYAYASFNDFFTRELKPGARPIDPDPSAICCPSDGTVQQAGHLNDGMLLQAKGMDYRLGQLLDEHARDIARFANGAYLTIYLAPHNYHRVHAPLAGTLRQMNFIPGTRFSVNQATARNVPALFARNERIACYCSDGPLDYWLVLVGAMNVASINTAWAGEIETGRSARHTTYAAPAGPVLARGDYFGHFNMGSTVIIIFPSDRVTWNNLLQPGHPLRMGQQIGRL